MKLTKPQLAQAHICSICAQGSEDPAEIAIVQRRRGWVHVFNNSTRCPGQGDDDTDDRATPLLRGGVAVTVAVYLAQYV